MKVLPICKVCMLNRVDKTMLVCGAGGRRAGEAKRAVERLLAREFGRSSNPSDVGTRVSMLAMRKAGSPDPYRRKKLEVMGKAEKIVGWFGRWVEAAGKNALGGRAGKVAGEAAGERFRRAALVAACGNMIEISAPHHKVDVGELGAEMRRAVRKGLAIDELEEIYERAKRARRILYLCDNCGEAVFDKILMAELKKHAKLAIAVASAPVDDDVTLKEAGMIGLGKLGRVLSKGQTFGIWKGKGTAEFWKAVREADLIIAKGMANYETITEYPEIERKTAFLLKAKCVTVGRSVGTPVGANVAMLGKAGKKAI